MSLPRLERIEARDPQYPVFRRQIFNTFYLAVGLSFVSIFLLQGLGILFAIFAMAWAIISVQLRIYHRQQVENFMHYRQTEALHALYSLVRPRQPLPPMRLWVISPDFGALLAGLIQQHKPRTIVELGSGVSTLIAAYALESTGVAGHITSFEHMDDFISTGQRRLEQHGLSQLVTLIHAPLTEQNGTTWYDTSTMQGLTAIDLLVVDGPPEKTQTSARQPALDVLYDKLADGALILVDDYLRDDEYRMVNAWVETYNLEVVETLATERGTAILRKRASQAPGILDTVNLAIEDAPTENENADTP
ncbi:MAG: hypothetical protein OHK0046_06370 [Anaerolineae bacterium]